MTKQDAIAWAGGLRPLARKLDIDPSAVFRWGDYPPKVRQYQIQVLSKNKLKVEKSA